MSLAVTVVAPAPLDATWARWCDFARWPEWNPACAAAEVHGPLEPGTMVELRLRHPQGGREFLTRPRITVVRPPRALGWVARGLGFRSEVSSELSDEHDGTRVTVGAATTGRMAFTYLMTFSERAQAALFQQSLTALSASLRAAA